MHQLYNILFIFEGYSRPWLHCLKMLYRVFLFDLTSLILLAYDWGIQPYEPLDLLTRYKLGLWAANYSPSTFNILIVLVREQQHVLECLP